MEFQCVIAFQGRGVQVNEGEIVEVERVIEDQGNLLVYVLVPSRRDTYNIPLAAFEFCFEPTDDGLEDDA